MSKEKPVMVGKNLSDLGGLVVATSAAGRLNLPELGKTRLMKKEEVVKVVEWINSAIAWVQENIQLVGEALADLTTMEYRPKEDILEAEAQIMKAVLEAPKGRAQEELTVALAAAICDFFPRSSVGLNHAANILVKIGFLTEAKEGTQEGQIVILPFSQPDGKWKATKFTFNFPGGRGILGRLREISAEVDEKRHELYEEKLVTLRQGVEEVNFLHVLKSGGEAVCFAPDSRSGEKFYGGGNIRVKVTDGRVSPVVAVGKCASFVSRLVEAGVSIPAEAIPSERILLRERVDDDAFRAMVGLHGLLHRAYTYAVEQARRAEAAEARRAEIQIQHDAMKTKATIWDTEGGPTAAYRFVVGGEDGVALLHLREWTVGSGESAKTHYGVTFLASRQGEIAVVDCLPQHEELFASCREFKAPGEKYADLPYPLSAMMRKLWAVLSNSARRRAAEANGSNAENGNGSSDVDEAAPEVEAQAETTES